MTKTKKLLNLILALAMMASMIIMPTTGQAAKQQKLLYEFDPTAPLTNNYDPWWAHNAVVVGNDIVTTGSNAVLGFYCGRDYLAARNGVYEFQADINSDLADMTLVSVVACTDSAEAELVRLYREGSNRHVMNLGQWQGGIGTNTATGVRAKARWDTSTKQITVTLTALSNNYTFPSRTYTIAGQYIDRIEFRSATRKISNVTFKKIANVPCFNESSVALKTIDGDVQSMTAASPKTKTVEFSFDEAMNEETLTEENIYITDASSNRVSYTGSYAGGVYKMTLDKKLKASTNYTLHISGNVASTDDEKMGSDKTVEFTTGIDSNETMIINANELPYFEDFESDEQLNNDTHPWIHWGGVTVANGHIVKSANKNLAFSTESLGTATTGKYIYECDLSAPSNAQGGYGTPVIFPMANINGTDTILAKIYTEGSNWYVTRFNTWVGGISAGSVLKFKMTWDADNGICSVDLTSAANGYNFGASSVRFTPGTAMPIIIFSGVAESYIDNVSLKLPGEYANLSDFDENAITLSKENGAVQNNWRALSPMTAKAEIAFGVPMKTETMSIEKIYIKDSNGNKVSGVSVYDDLTHKWTMDFDELLTPGETYTMHIDGTVADRYENVLGQDMDIGFTVKNEQFSIEDTVIGINGTNVSGFAGFTAGSQADIEFNYINVTGETASFKLVVPYYDEQNKLLYVDIADASAENSSEVEHKTVSYTVREIENAVSAKIMLLKDLSNIKPLTKNISLN